MLHRHPRWLVAIRRPDDLNPGLVLRHPLDEEANSVRQRVRVDGAIRTVHQVITIVLCLRNIAQGIANLAQDDLRARLQLGSFDSAWMCSGCHLVFRSGSPPIEEGLACDRVDIADGPSSRRVRPVNLVITPA